MGRARDRARRFYNQDLQPGEEILAVRNATVAGVGRLFLIGATIGSLLGWLLAINVDSPLLPALVFGALAGVLGGYVAAVRQARRPDGPGAVHVQVVQTNQRLFTTRRYTATRTRVLRDYRDATATIAKRYPVGHYRRLDIATGEGPATSFIVEGPLDLP